MDTIAQKHAEADRRLARLRRLQASYWLLALATFALGAGFGYLVAELIIDPITVVPGCGGIQV